MSRSKRATIEANVTPSSWGFGERKIESLNWVDAVDKWLESCAER
jgi:hypothetical protein